MANTKTTAYFIPRNTGSPHVKLDNGSLDEPAIARFQKALFEQVNITKEEHRRGYRYSGTKEQLINAGLSIDGWFPRDLENSRNTLRVVFPHNLHDGIVVNDPRTRARRNMRCVEIAINGESNFVLVDLITKSEQNEKRRLYELRLDSEHYAAAKEEESIALANLAISKEDVQNKLTMFASVTLRILFDNLKDGSRGYKFSKSSLDKINETMTDLMEAIESGNMVFDSKERLSIEQSIRAKTARLDSGFSGFLSRIISSPSAIQDNNNFED